MAISQKKKIDFIKHRAEGKSLRAIAASMGIAYNTCLSLSKELDTEVRNQRSMEYEEILALYSTSKRFRLEAISAQIKRVQEEIHNRDLADVPTDKLFAIHERLNKQIIEDTKGLSLLHESSPLDDLNRLRLMTTPCE